MKAFSYKDPTPDDECNEAILCFAVVDGSAVAFCIPLNELGVVTKERIEAADKQFGEWMSVKRVKLHSDDGN